MNHWKYIWSYLDSWEYLDKGVYHSFKAQHKLLDRLFAKWNINE